MPQSNKKNTSRCSRCRFRFGDGHFAFSHSHLLDTTYVLDGNRLSNLYWDSFAFNLFNVISRYKTVFTREFTHMPPVIVGFIQQEKHLMSCQKAQMVRKKKSVKECNAVKYFSLSQSCLRMALECITGLDLRNKTVFCHGAVLGSLVCFIFGVFLWHHTHFILPFLDRIVFSAIWCAAIF